MEDNTMSTEATEKLIFEEGKTYTNRRGDFVVVSISGQSMTIRWNDGHTVDTPMDLQARIIANMEIDNRVKTGKPQKKKSSPPAIKLKADFTGLTPIDFEKKIAGTTWRNQNCLGGYVAIRLAAKSLTFRSQAVSRMPAVIFQDVTHRGQNTPSQAKFFVRLDHNELIYGFTIKRGPAIKDEKQDWDGLMDFLTIPENDEWLNQCSLEESLTLTLDRFEAGMTKSDILKPSEDSWLCECQGDEKWGNGLTDFLNTSSPEAFLTLTVFKTIKKDAVVEKGILIADDISSLFNKLMPLYAGAAIIS